MSKSQTITSEDWSEDPADWLPNPHAGEMLRLEFMEPLELSPDKLAEALQIAPERLTAMLDGHRRIDADLDLRLGRYFGMSEGFFLRLQVSYELLEAKRALNGSLDRIVPRAA
jgi:addiction module HigA family antidote